MFLTCGGPPEFSNKHRGRKRKGCHTHKCQSHRALKDKTNEKDAVQQPVEKGGFKGSLGGRETSIGSFVQGVKITPNKSALTKWGRRGRCDHIKEFGGGEGGAGT